MLNSTRILRKNPPKIFYNLNDTILNKNDLNNTNTFINQTLKQQFYNKYNKLSIDNKTKMYLVKLFIYETNEYCYKIGITDYPLINRLKSLNGKYKSNYDIELIHYYNVNHRNIERIFHNKNKKLLYNYHNLMGKNDIEIYKTDDIIQKFIDFGNSLL
jgi:hypothetical protein